MIPTHQETWRPVSGFDDAYEVSSAGRVRSKERRVKSGVRNTLVKGRILRQFKDDRGYPCVGLCRDNAVKTIKVHRLVAEAFVSGAADGMTVNHIDMNKTNNAATNLEWVSFQDNHAHAIAHHTHCPHRNPNIRRKLTPEVVDLIRSEGGRGVSYREIGRRYSITHVNARAIILGLQWKS